MALQGQIGAVIRLLSLVPACWEIWAHEFMACVCFSMRYELFAHPSQATSSFILFIKP